MLAAIIEPMSTGMPSHPMPPNTTSTGSALGMNHDQPRRDAAAHVHHQRRDRAERPARALDQAVEQLALRLVHHRNHARVHDVDVVGFSPAAFCVVDPARPRPSATASYTARIGTSSARSRCLSASLNPGPRITPSTLFNSAATRSNSSSSSELIGFLNRCALTFLLARNGPGSSGGCFSSVGRPEDHVGAAGLPVAALRQPLAAPSRSPPAPSAPARPRRERAARPSPGRRRKTPPRAR